MQQQAHSSKVWFITGAARGIGLSLARQALAQGNAVAATSRTLASLQQAFGDKHERLLPLEVDLVDEASVQAAIDRTVATFGRIDCVVNNAGYGQQGTIEALSDAELRRNFDVNVFAPLHVLRHALPHLRAQRSGHVQRGLHRRLPGRVCGLGQLRGQQVRAGRADRDAGGRTGRTEHQGHRGVSRPGAHWVPVQDTLVVAARSIADYTEAQASLDLHLNGLDGKQAGDPEKVATLILQAAAVAEPPVHLFAGKIANTLAEQKMQAVRKDLMRGAAPPMPRISPSNFGQGRARGWVLRASLVHQEITPCSMNCQQKRPTASSNPAPSCWSPHAAPRVAPT